MIRFSAISSASRCGRALRWPLRLLPRDLVLPVMQGPLRGARWITGSAVHGCWLGSYELDKQLAIVEQVRKADVVYDVGANVGFYTLLASRLAGDSGRVYAFEPLPRNVAVLRRHLELNAVDNVEVFACAVGDRSGEARFDDSTATPELGRLDAHGRLAVDLVTLDELVAASRIRPPACIKMDVEGAEAMVLRGAMQTLRAHRPVLFVATHGPAVHRECLEILEELGYEVAGLAGDDPADTDELVCHPRGERRATARAARPGPPPGRGAVG